MKKRKPHHDKHAMGGKKMGRDTGVMPPKKDAAPKRGGRMMKMRERRLEGKAM